jgi:hypothetical protein
MKEIFEEKRRVEENIKLSITPFYLFFLLYILAKERE